MGGGVGWFKSPRGIPNSMATLYYAEHVHTWTRIWIAIQTRIPNRFCTHLCGYLYSNRDPSPCPTM